MSITCIENLSNEFFYEIFDYFDGIDIINSFSNFNHRFEELLNSSCLLFKIKFLPPSDECDSYMNIWKNLINIHKKQIYSFHACILSQYKQFLSLFPIDQSFNHLESLILILKNLSSLPKLLSLIINTFNVEEKINDIYRLIFILPRLKYYRICSFDNHHSITLPMIINNNQVSSIEYIAIDHYCSFNELAIIISYTPQLRHLILDKIKINDSRINILSSLRFINLKSIYFHLYETTFNQLEMFITKTFSNLKCLSIMTSKDIAFLDAYKWEQFILNYFPQLEKFSFIYNDYIDYGQQFGIFSYFQQLLIKKER